MKIFEAVRRFQEQIKDLGLGRSVLALPAPKTIALPYFPEEQAESNVFTFTITEPEIESVSRDLFASGHYSIAVQEAFKALEKAVAKISGRNASGTSLMDQVFSPKTPVLCWSDRLTTSEVDEQNGYHRLFAGAMLGIRNPVTHEFSWIDDAEIALELLVLRNTSFGRRKRQKR